MHLSTSTPAARRAFHALAGCTPLLLSLAIGNAYAVEVTIVGRNGADGTPGVTGPTPSGGNGQSALAERYVFGSQDARNTLALYGGRGGRGGDGGEPGTLTETQCNAFGDCHDVATDYDGGVGGMGGNGAAAVGSVTTRSGTMDGVAESRVVGGDGGSPGIHYSSSIPPAFGTANGGDATSNANVFVTGAASARAYALAIGGSGSFASFYAPANSANAGQASARAHAQSDTGAVTVFAGATAGAAGYSKNVGLSVEMINAVSGSTNGALTLGQRAEGGISNATVENRAGDGISTLTLSDARANRLSANIEAVGGVLASGNYGKHGNGYATLTLTSTRVGASVDGTVSASGGGGWRGSSGGGEGPVDDNPLPQRAANAEARATLTGLGTVTGNATAIGGDALGMRGGSALASLTLSGIDLVSGNATARGGAASPSGAGDWSTYGPAEATLTMSGAGARGQAFAIGVGGVTSNVNTTTSGMLAVDVVSRADNGGDQRFLVSPSALNANINVQVASGGGQASVNAAASANGLSNPQASAYTTVRVVANGDITATGSARGGYAHVADGENAFAGSSVRGETSGNHLVTVTACALSNSVSATSGSAYWGSAAADAYGRSGSGVVNARAEAHAIRDARAEAIAVTLERGGVSNAFASASGTGPLARDLAASASMSALDRQGAAMTFSGSAAGTGSASATAASSNQFSLASLALDSSGGGMRSIVMAAPERAALLAALPAAQTLENVVGAGMQAMGSSRVSSEWEPVLQQNTVGEFQFAAKAGEHLQVLFLSGSGQFDTFELSISNNGAELFSRAFDAASAQQFFNGYLLDLGALGTRMQNLRISSSMAFYQPGSFAFNYLAGSGPGVAAAVPEASTWLLLLVGMGGMLLVARRRRA